MQTDMAKFDMGYSEANADFSPFSTPSEFFRWVSTNHGNDVLVVCKDRIQQHAESGKKPSALAVLRELVQTTRDIDVSRTGIVARFVY